MNYLLEDPERNVTKIMDMLDKVAPADLFPSQRTAFRNAIEFKNNWYELLMRVLDLNPAMRNDFIRMFLVDANMMAWPEQEANAREVSVQHPLGPADGSDKRLQPALHRLLGRRVRQARRT